VKEKVSLKKKKGGEKESLEAFEKNQAKSTL